MDRKSSTVIYRAFYLLLHSVFTLYELVEFSYNNVRNKLLELYHEFFPLATTNFQKIPKIPQHVTVLLGTEAPSYHDLANLILWSLTAGVPFISFYDHKGILKKNEDKLHQVVDEKKNVADHVIWHSHPNVVHKNGYVGRKIHVKVLTECEGRGGVVEMTKKFALDAGDITSNSFENGLKRQFEFPDPDLGLCCGKTFSLYGYPPWQIRVTEFLTLNSHHDVTLDSFVKLLFRFNKCEQRYGK